MDARAHRLFTYNDSAAAVWHALGRGGDGGRALCDAYGITRKQAQADAATIVTHWQALGLVSGGSEAARNRTGNRQVGPIRPEGPGETRLATYRIGRRVFDIAVSDDDVARRVEALFRSFVVRNETADESLAVHRCDGGGGLVLVHNGEDVLRVDTVAEVTGALFQAMLGDIHPGARWLAIIHGGAVCSGERAVLLPGSSGSGKSTLGAFLVSRGLGFLCDDMLPVTRDGDVANWPAPISIKEGSWKALAPYLPQLDTIKSEFVWGRTMKFVPGASPSWTPQTKRAGIIIFPKFDRTAGAAKMTKLRPIEALQRLISDRIWLGYPLRGNSVEWFLAWLAGIPSYALSYSDFDSVERLIGETTGRA